MGFLTTRWEATYGRHEIAVTRNELGRGFGIEWDGREIVRRRWSWFGLGELHATVDADGQRHEIHLTLSVGSGPGEGLLTDGRCTITVDGVPVEARHIH